VTLGGAARRDRQLGAMFAQNPAHQGYACCAESLMVGPANDAPREIQLEEMGRTLQRSGGVHRGDARMTSG